MILRSYYSVHKRIFFALNYANNVLKITHALFLKLISMNIVNDSNLNWMNTKQCKRMITMFLRSPMMIIISKHHPMVWNMNEFLAKKGNGTMWQKTVKPPMQTSSNGSSILSTSASLCRQCQHAMVKQETSCIDRLLIVNKQSSRRS